MKTAPKSREEALRTLAARQSRIDGEIARTQGIHVEVRARQRYDRLAFSAFVVAKSLLLRGMMAYRLNRDVGSAMADFSQGCNYGEVLHEAIGLVNQAMAAEVAPKPIPMPNPAHFEPVMCCCLLCGSDEKAKALAAVLRDETAALDILDHAAGDVLTRLLAAVILDDKLWFATLKQHYDRLKKNKDWDIFFVVYGELYQAAIDRNQGRFDSLLGDAEQGYLARASNKKFTDLLPEYGGQQENTLVFDFMATCAARLAHRNDLKLHKDSDVIPRELIER